MSATSCAISTEPDTRTPAQIANDKAWVDRGLDREADRLFEELEYYLDQDIQICLNRLAQCGNEMLLKHRTRDSRHHQRVE